MNLPAHFSQIVFQIHYAIISISMKKCWAIALVTDLCAICCGALLQFLMSFAHRRSHLPYLRRTSVKNQQIFYRKVQKIYTSSSKSVLEGISTNPVEPISNRFISMPPLSLLLLVTQLHSAQQERLVSPFLPLQALEQIFYFSLCLCVDKCGKGEEKVWR